MRVLRIAAALCLIPTLIFATDPRDTVIEDFEDGEVVLASYPDQDQDPGDWSLITSDTWQGSDYSLRLYGNTWKTQSMAAGLIDEDTVWEVAVYVEDQDPPHTSGEMIGFGVSDGVNELLYSFAGSQLPEDPKWWTVYQGDFPEYEWFPYLLPVGEDWMATYGYLPEITSLIYVNDKDSGGGSAVVFDGIRDVTEDLPQAPSVSASYTVTAMKRLGGDRFRASVQFYADVIDPDSESHDFHWDFGDSTSSADQNPSHDFIVEADYDFTVSVLVVDEDAHVGSDTCQVAVEEGESPGAFTINFVGDIMIGRAYENNGGIIDTYGVDAIFEPTYSLLGDAADVSYANLEVPFTDQGSPHPTKSVVFRARRENIVGVANAGIDIVSLGNNHIVDYGTAGMLQTMQLLDQHEIRYSGAGVNDYFANLPTYWTERGVRMAFLGSSNRTGRKWNYQPFLDAGASKSGFAYFLPKNLEKSIEDTLPLADVVIMQTHSGDEYETAPPPDAFGGAADLPALIEAQHPHLNDPDLHFRNEPTPGERELRQMSLDLGAHVHINHHPHVLQGFEAYEGKLIAHSLGNFIFDLYYPETMPTLVLTLEIDKQGIQGYTFTPAWIDDYITQPATGRLGREIMDLMADYSRPMGALVATFPDDDYARVFVDPTEAQEYVNESSGMLSFVEEDGVAMSAPFELAGQGSLSKIVALSGEGLGDWEIRFGRELAWHGGFEDDGATFWHTNSDDEWIDDSQAYAGQRSLALRRDSGDDINVGSDLEKYLRCDSEKEHSFLGLMRGESAGECKILLRFYQGRNDNYQNYITSTELGAPWSGNFDWSKGWRNLETPGNAAYFDIRAQMDPPGSGEGLSWADELKFVEWDAWIPGSANMEVPHPGNFRFVQVRASNTSLTSADLNYEEVAYDWASTGTDEAPSAVNILLHPYPNPFNPTTNLTLAAPTGVGKVPAKLEIFDLQGRRLATLFDGELAGGTRRVFTWQGRDQRGRQLASGIYFAKASVGLHTTNAKLVLLK
ncbi:CapA family protein [bacterium]|nr:CapA family protein [bacterium]